MFSVELEVTNPNMISAYEYAVSQTPDLTYQVVNETVNEVSDEVLAELRTEPPPVKLPFIWTSAKQRMAFFATNGFGRGIGAPRTHALVEAWKLMVNYDGQSMTSTTLSNDIPYRPYVIGPDQQIGHINTGWYNEAEAMDRANAKLLDRVETSLIKVLYLIDALAETRMH